MTKYYIVADGIPRREISEEQAHECMNHVKMNPSMNKVKEETTVERDSMGMGHISTEIEYEVRYGV